MWTLYSPKRPSKLFLLLFNIHKLYKKRSSSDEKKNGEHKEAEKNQWCEPTDIDPMCVCVVLSYGLCTSIPRNL